MSKFYYLTTPIYSHYGDVFGWNKLGGAYDKFVSYEWCSDARAGSDVLGVEYETLHMSEEKATYRVYYDRGHP